MNGFWRNKEGDKTMTTNDKYIEKRVAREILNIIERISFSEEYKEYRINYGSNSQRDLIIQMIQERYEVK
jgi:hypothetical protein